MRGRVFYSIETLKVYVYVVDRTCTTSRGKIAKKRHRNPAESIWKLNVLTVGGARAPPLLRLLFTSAARNQTIPYIVLYTSVIHSTTYCTTTIILFLYSLFFSHVRLHYIYAPSLKCPPFKSNNRKKVSFFGCANEIPVGL